MRTIISVVNKDFFDSFFYVFGLVDNPAKAKATEVVKEDASEKIKNGIGQTNYAIRESYNNFKDSLLLERP